MCNQQEVIGKIQIEYLFYSMGLLKSVDFKVTILSLAREVSDIVKHSRAACFIASFSAISAASLAAASLNQTTHGNDFFRKWVLSRIYPVGLSKS